MKTDRELLEAAASAAKLPDWAWQFGAITYLKDGVLTEWDPLNDDADAFRLAVQLRLQVTPGTYNPYEASAFRAGAAEAHEKASMGYSIEEATRRAIVRAAAALGGTS